MKGGGACCQRVLYQFKLAYYWLLIHWEQQQKNRFEGHGEAKHDIYFPYHVWKRVLSRSDLVDFLLVCYPYPKRYNLFFFFDVQYCPSSNAYPTGSHFYAHYYTSWLWIGDFVTKVGCDRIFNIFSQPQYALTLMYSM